MYQGSKHRANTPAGDTISAILLVECLGRVVDALLWWPTVTLRLRRESALWPSVGCSKNQKCRDQTSVTQPTIVMRE